MAGSAPNLAAVKLLPPEQAVLDAVPNPHIDSDYLVRFTAPEFTTLCPITGQPDFAHFVIDYAPGGKIVESKSPAKLFLQSFSVQCQRLSRRHHAEDRQAYTTSDQTEIHPDCGLLVSPRRHAHRCVLAVRKIAVRRLAAGDRCLSVQRPGLVGPRLRGAERFRYLLRSRFRHAPCCSDRYKPAELDLGGLRRMSGSTSVSVGRLR